MYAWENSKWNLYCHLKPWKHKILEVQLDRWSGMWFRLSLVHMPRNVDHWGYYFTLAICTITLDINFYDERHAEVSESEFDGRAPKVSDIEWD